ncbi:sodium:solute symporter [Saccharothrix violaceirubra]|uniref:SSS family transporter n=1 Tax=Saccharothrix violaceirubra TaxID=413306 RepID=A0A7W7SZR9_9PSEU|nr:sodium:solute symporter [Saccharothrix violaceirubra]MBB4963924.1 SSS family transporter [Saccharothrix violaceirubra]
MRVLDLGIIALFLIGMPLLGALIGGRQRSATDYFVSERRISWWVVCVSVVSAETSTLTVLSVPTVAYGGTMTFLSLAVGYLLGRIVVSFVLLPRYVAGDLITAYGFLGRRFGPDVQATASVTFLITRLLADGLRLFATAIPVKVVLAAYGVDVSYWVIVAVLGAAMVVYSFLGGVRAVVWVDAIQLLWYVLGAAVVIVVLSGLLPDGWFTAASDAGKFRVLDFAANPLTSPYAVVTALVGGAVLSMASHGADQLVVQRLMATRDVRSARRALIGSGVVVFLQFALFLLIGVMLWAFYKGAPPVAGLGLHNNDELFAHFVVREMPTGLSGFVMAGILAAALSSSLGAMASSTVADVYRRFARRETTEQDVLRQGRIWTVVWAVLLVVCAGLFSSLTRRGDPIVEQGLSISGFTYGALLGSFLLGLLVRRARRADALVAFVVTVAVMTFVILGVDFGGKALAYPWYTSLGVVVTLVVGGLLSLRGTGDSRPSGRHDGP